MTVAVRASEIDVGDRLRTVRTVRQMSQRELARRSGVTNGLISQIEQNQTNPTISSLKRILDAIPMSLSEFFADEGPDEPKSFFRAVEMRELNIARVLGRQSTVGEISLRQVGDSFTHNIQMLHEVYAPGSDTGEDMYTHSGEEAGIVVSGTIEITVGTEVCVLEPGDGYMFSSQIPHRFRNTGDQDCVLISACTPPTF
jgi:transcriptional regulator with XRE-family HTH domain